jgi:hypothetical protein
VPGRGTFCAVPWHILCLPMAHKSSFCAVLWHILCLPVAHRPKSLFVTWYGTCCAFPWHISLKVFLCHAVKVIIHAVAHGILLSRIASQELHVKNCTSRIASQELQVKNCKSRIAKKKSFRQFGHVFLAA